MTISEMVQNSVQILRENTFNNGNYQTKFYTVGGWLLDLDLNHYNENDKIKEIVFVDYARHNNKIKKKVMQDKKGFYFNSYGQNVYINEIFKTRQQNEKYLY